MHACIHVLEWCLSAAMASHTAPEWQSPAQHRDSFSSLVRFDKKKKVTTDCDGNSFVIGMMQS